MSRLSLKALQAAAGAAGGAGEYVEDVFSTYLYDGNASSQTITNGIDLDGEGGLTWFKARDDSTFHILFDTERGGTKWLNSASSNTESTASPAWITYNSDGFTLPQGINGLNNTQEMASWTFRKAPKFFDIVTYTGDGTFNRSIPHNLDGQAGMVAVKCTSHAEDWGVCHRSATGGSSSLNGTGAFTGTAFDLTLLSDTAFGVQGRGATNALGQEYIAYVFAHNDGDGEFGESGDQDIIKCGGYTGNGTAGNEIDLGFEPQWLMIKKASSTGSWEIIDSMRGIVSGGNDAFLRANTSGTEFPNTYDYADLTATGFSLSNDINVNQSGQDYVYMAIRRPHKPAEEFAATDLFALDQGGTVQEPTYQSGFPVDWGWDRQDVTTAQNPRFFTRMLGDTNCLIPTNTGAEISGNTLRDMDYMDGWVSGSRTSNAYSWMWRRAPGFFDVVAYTGTGSARTVPHNLGVAPELMIIKNRDRATQWTIYSSDLGISYHTFFNSAASVANGDTLYYFNSTAPTESVFSVGTATYTNQTGEAIIAYLFATVPGISKVGSYTGTGSDVDVDCGFTSGARFVLVKRTDSTGDWYVWDSERGIVAGNDPYLLLNTTAAQVTSTDYIDPLSSGFRITSSAPAALNNSGGTYIFLAIA